ncbi:hypothetical protein MRB53_038118 [Persea americana]|nr:hypothetical protein MRB53_038118 [Persea americana]
MPSTIVTSEKPANLARRPVRTNSLILPPPAFRNSIPAPTLQYQGAEALVYRTFFLHPSLNIHCALKHRPSKPYRHPVLDAKLTRHRILAEARVLAKLRRAGISVPAVYALDWEAGWLCEEWIEGETVRAVLDRSLAGWLDAADNDEGERVNGSLERLMRRIGTLVGQVHENGVVHGDLTTSNVMLRASTQTSQDADKSAALNELDGEAVLIDFGLASQSVQDEDRAVDLYVLERAFGSTHPKTESLFGEVLKAYGQSYKGAKVALKKLEEVRMRGRKKIMIG